MEEDFGKLGRLLQELSDFARDYGYKQRAFDRQRKQRSTPPSAAGSDSANSSTRRVATQSLRIEAAADRLAVSTTTFAAVSAAAADNQPDLGNFHFVLRCFHGSSHLSVSKNAGFPVTSVRAWEQQRYHI